MFLGLCFWCWSPFGVVLTGTLAPSCFILELFRFPRQVIKVTFALSILLYLGFAAYCLYRKWWIPGVITLIFGLLYAWMWWAWKSRIPFATVSKRFRVEKLITSWGLVFFFFAQNAKRQGPVMSLHPIPISLQTTTTTATQHPF